MLNVIFNSGKIPCLRRHCTANPRKPSVVACLALFETALQASCEKETWDAADTAHKGPCISRCGPGG